MKIVLRTNFTIAMMYCTLEATRPFAAHPLLSYPEVGVNKVSGFLLSLFPEPSFVVSLRRQSPTSWGCCFRFWQNGQIALGTIKILFVPSFFFSFFFARSQLHLFSKKGTHLFFFLLSAKFIPLFYFCFHKTLHPLTPVFFLAFLPLKTSQDIVPISPKRKHHNRYHENSINLCCYFLPRSRFATINPFSRYTFCMPNYTTARFFLRHPALRTPRVEWIGNFTVTRGHLATPNRLLVVGANGQAALEILRKRN